MYRNKGKEPEQLVLNISTEGLWDWECNTDRLYWSPQYYKLIGYPGDTTLFDTDFFKMIINPDDRQELFTAILKFLHKKKGRINFTGPEFPD